MTSKQGNAGTNRGQPLPLPPLRATSYLYKNSLVPYRAPYSGFRFSTNARADSWKSSVLCSRNGCRYRSASYKSFTYWRRVKRTPEREARGGASSTLSASSFATIEALSPSNRSGQMAEKDNAILGPGYAAAGPGNFRLGQCQIEQFDHELWPAGSADWLSSLSSGSRLSRAPGGLQGFAGQETV